MDPLTRRELLSALAAVPIVGQLRGAGARPTADELVGLDAVEIAARRAAREISIVELVEAYIRRIDTLNPALGAYVTVTAERARADAKRIDRLARTSPVGPLAGVPIAHKDLFETAGIRTTAGSRLYDRHVPTRDADLVQALARAGSVLLGKTNTHELGGGVTTINPFYGTTRNPWDRSRIPGGSSGGSAAAVVAGMAVAATGSDTGGSVRIPAALCGCVGFKPSFGRVSTRGLLGACPTFDHVGVLTRTVADADVILQAVERSAPRGAPPTPFAPLAPLRIGVPRAYFFDHMPPDVARAIEDALVVLRSLAAEVRDVTFPIDEQTMATIFDPIVIVEIQARFAGDWQTRPDAFSPSFAAFLQSERPAPAAVDAARRALDGYRRDVEAVFRSVDLLVLPTVPVTAPPIDGPIDGGLILRNTWPFNAAGTPALSVPCGLDGRGLPIGLQLVGAVGNDRRVLDSGRAFQAATAWHQRRPAAADA